MTSLIVELSKFVFILFIAMYTFLSFSVLRKKNQEEINHGWRVQNLLTVLIQVLACVVLLAQTEQEGQEKLLLF